MNRYLLDTSAYSNFMRGHPRATSMIDSADWLGLPIIVIGELDVGFLLGRPSRLESNRQGLRDFIDNPSVEVIELSRPTGQIYAEILVSLRRNGKKIPTNDIWIAAAAVQLGVDVLTFDRHFEAIQRVGSVVLD
ncbi:MAG: type II toxin-antitoxin system VapC family toxin [Acidobacteriota bacterium]